MRTLIAIVLALAFQTAECAAEAWELVKPDNLGFSVELPGKPEFKEEEGDDGGKIRTYAVRSAAAAYDVTIWDLPDGAVGPENVSQFLDNFRERNLDGISAKLRTEAKIEIGGQPARDVTADVMGMVWRGPHGRCWQPSLSDRRNRFESRRTLGDDRQIFIFV